jgi:tetratricopeptide (TPR) repeat protein
VSEEAVDPPAEGTSLHQALGRARAGGESELALAFVRRLLDIDPDDARARQIAEEIEAEGREKEAEQLCAIALAYAADGEMDKAAEIAEKIERLSPWSPRYLQLQVYLDEESARLNPGGAPGASGDDALARDLEEALRAEGLGPESPPLPSTEAPTRAPDPPPNVADAAASDASRSNATGSNATGPGDKPTRPADVEILTSAALERFLKDDHPGARRAATMALELDPRNRKALELLKILGALG